MTNTTKTQVQTVETITKAIKNSKPQLQQNIKHEEPQAISMLTHVRQNGVKGLLQAVKIDNMLMKSKLPAKFKAKEYLEVILYNEYIKNNENQEKEIYLSFDNATPDLITALKQAPNILGVDKESIKFDIKVNFTCKVKTPYSKYRDSLEAQGFQFTSKQDEQHIRMTTEQMETLQEINSMARAAGLPEIQY